MLKMVKVKVMIGVRRGTCLLQEWVFSTAAWCAAEGERVRLASRPPIVGGGHSPHSAGLKIPGEAVRAPGVCVLLEMALRGGVCRSRRDGDADQQHLWSWRQGRGSVVGTRVLTASSFDYSKG